MHIQPYPALNHVTLSMGSWAVSPGLRLLPRHSRCRRSPRDMSLQRAPQLPKGSPHSLCCRLGAALLLCNGSRRLAPSTFSAGRNSEEGIVKGFIYPRVQRTCVTAPRELVKAQRGEI